MSLIATILKFGERTQIGAVLLATGLVAGLQLIVAALVWGMVAHVTGTGLQPSVMVVIVSLVLAAGGRLLAVARAWSRACGARC